MQINISKKKTMYITIAIAAVIILISGAYAVVNYVSSGITAVSADEATVYDVFEAEAYAVRDENLIYSDLSGTVVASVGNASKVNAQTTVAAIFSDPEAAKNYSQLNYLYDKLKGYRMIDSQLTLANVDVEALGDAVDDDFESVLDAVYDGEFSSIGERKLDYLVDISRRQIVTGADIDCSVQIAQLEQQISAIEASLTPSAVVTAGKSGYYKSSADGYEGLLAEEGLESLSVEQFEAVLKTEPKTVNSNCVGVIVEDCRWNLVLAVDTQMARKLEIGKKYSIIVDGTGEKKITAVVESINEDGDSGRAVVSFRCNTVDEKILAMRKMNVTVIIAEYTGVYIPSEAVRIVDGKECVYINYDETPRKRELNIVYTGDDYVISKPYTDAQISNDPSLADVLLVEVYDEVIIEGKGLSNDT
ncbi:MAG: hypothetical protein IJC37_06525 [Clostridia bacterium]|nr:hypothetical protein [Clostridia bacterium]